MIFAFEGVDAAGKATQTKRLVERLQKYGHAVKTFSFPNYESITGVAIAENLRRVWDICSHLEYPNPNLKLTQELTFQSLYIVNRLERAPELMECVNNPTNHAVLGRYTMSGVAYGSARGLPLSWLQQVQQFLPQPTIWFLLNTTLAESVKRRPERRDRLEADAAYLERVRKVYLSIFHSERHEDREKWYVLDGCESIDDVAETVWDIVEYRLQDSRTVVSEVR